MQTEISIRPVLNGWLVGAGCQVLAYENKQKLLLDLGEWLERPNETEARILKEAQNNKILMQQPGRAVGIRTFPPNQVDEAEGSSQTGAGGNL